MVITNQPSNGQSKSSAFNYFVIFILGLLIAANIFTIYQYAQLQRLTEGLRTDTVNIIQAYNNLVNTLSQQGVIKSQAQTQPTVQQVQPNK